MRKTPIIVLHTDFGQRDPFVGVMKGVILNAMPTARIVDLSHEIPPQNIQAGAFQLMVSYEYFPAGSIFVCVVDPGVGSNRDILAVRTKRYIFLAPDNGILSWVLEREVIRKVVVVKNRRFFLPSVSKTFHGRDIFAPVAAHIGRGLPLDRLGPNTRNYDRLKFPRPVKKGDLWKGEVLAIDGFGNLVTNLKGKSGVRRFLKIARWKIPCVNHYAAVTSGKLLGVVGSSGYWEISLRNGNAARKTKARMGTSVLFGKI